MFGFAPGARLVRDNARRLGLAHTFAGIGFDCLGG